MASCPPTVTLTLPAWLPAAGSGGSGRPRTTVPFSPSSAKAAPGGGGAPAARWRRRPAPRRPAPCRPRPRLGGHEQHATRPRPRARRLAAGLRPRAAPRGAAPGTARLVAEAVEAVLGHEVEAAVGDGEAAPELDLPALRHGEARGPAPRSGPPGLEDRDVAVHLGREDLAVGEAPARRGRWCRGSSRERLARLRVEGVEVGGVVHDVQPAGVEDRGREAGGEAVGVPDAAPSSVMSPVPVAVDGDDWPMKLPSGLSALARVDGVAHHRDRAVQRRALSRYRHRLARLRAAARRSSRRRRRR